MSLFFLLPTSPNTSHTPVGGSENSTDSGPAASVGIRFNTDGTIDVKSTGSWGYERDWITPNTGFTASEWEVQAVKTGGSGIALALEGAGYQTISSTVTFDDAFLSGTHNWTGNITVREIADTANTVTFIFTASTEP